MNVTQAAAGTLIRPRILIVDDEPEVLEALSSLLVPRVGSLFDVEEAASAEEALEIITATGAEGIERPVALVISDEKMPGMAGTDLLVALRQHENHRHGGRIVITGYAGLESAKKAINDAEVDRYFPKPWDAEGSLLPAIGEILDRFAAKRGLDSLVLAGAVESGGLEAVRAVRKSWWEYLLLLGDDFGGDEEWESNEGEDLLPPLTEAEDEGAVHILARRISPREERPVGSLRLRTGDDGVHLLDALAFAPEEAGDELETLLLRTALLHAAGKGIATLRTAAPILRRDVYEALGFREAASSKSPAPATVLLECRCAEPAFTASAHAARFKKTATLCSCSQSACPSRDYAADRRSYFCPLDLHQGRIPERFPGRRD